MTRRPHRLRLAAFAALSTLTACGDDNGGAASDAGARPDAADVAADGWTADVVGRDVAGDASDASDGAETSDAVADAGRDAPDDTVDAGIDTSDANADADAGPACANPWPRDDDARAVLVSHPFTEDVEVPGTTVRPLRLRPDGSIDDDGPLIDVGIRVARIAFARDRQVALAVDERGELVSLVRDEGRWRVVSRVTLPSASFGDIHFADDGLAHIVGFNSVASGGVNAVRVGCDGGVSVVDDAFFSIRLAQSLAPVGKEYAVLLGGQAVFEPVDDDDIRLLSRDGDGWTQVGAFDVYGDAISAGRIAASPQGDRVLVPNGSPFSTEGATVSVLSVDGASVREVDRLDDMGDASEALFSEDGRTALVSLVEDGRIAVLAREASGAIVEVERIAGIGLPDQMARVLSGPNADMVLIPSVDTSGASNIAMLRIDSVGVVSDLGQFDLGGGLTAIPDAIAIQP